MLKSYTEELSHVIAQAQDVKQDLVQLMEDSLGLSQTLINDLDARLAGNEKIDENIAGGNCEPSDQEEQEYPGNIVKFAPTGTSRIRVYDLARELRISSRELVQILQGCGLKITSHMNLIDAEQTRALINKINNSADPLELYPSLSSNQVENAAADDEASFIAGLQSAQPYMAVRSLYEKGYPVWQIAKILGRGQGEVNLILNLSNKRAGSI